ncbi:MAG: DUF2997 domain-containing protein [Candidatus Omnitrophica bacterium]|nr:DUF2997 domain-containing protein [Candidatus Omnitrophota bacterium]
MGDRIDILLRRRSDGAEVLAQIDTEGNVSITVRNARGLSCRALTATLEAELGDVTARKMDPRALAAAGLTEEQIDKQLNRAGLGGGWCG